MSFFTHTARTACALTLASLWLGPAIDVEAARRGPGKPTGGFNRADEPPAPDYRLHAAWAALPESEDSADIAPRGAQDRQAKAEVDVFFVHPTTYLLGGRWNATLGTNRIDQRTDLTTIRNQASVFNGAGRIYAPRFRQAILYAYLHDDADSLKARALAYSDVARAFDAYLEHHSAGRPFILAGHSQGAHHLLRLLEERLADPELRQRLVAAYLVGVPMPADKLERTLNGIPQCISERQTGCLVSWNTVASWADRSRFSSIAHYYPAGWESNAGKVLVCSNPLSWRDGEKPAASAGPRRAVAVSHRGPLLRAPGPASARCAEGLLEIEDPRGPSFRLTRGRKGDYHVFDLSLFHLDIRENARLRAESYLAGR